MNPPVATHNASLGARLAQPAIVLAPGVYDALTATLAEMAGFEALYLSGAAIAYTRLGRPDIGLVSMNEVADTLSLVCDRVSVPVIVDADTGFGNALNVERTVQTFEKAGAAALQLEDQTFPKRCGHLSGKTLVSAQEMAGKIRAAVAARRNPATLIIARTDAIAVEGFDAAMVRAEIYRSSGADVLFVEAPRDRAQLEQITAHFNTGSANHQRARIPLMANMVEGGDTPVLSAQELEAIGFNLVIFPAAIVRILARTAQEFYTSLASDGTSDAMRSRMHDFTQLNQLLGTGELLARGAKYGGDDQ